MADGLDLGQVFDVLTAGLISVIPSGYFLVRRGGLGEMQNAEVVDGFWLIVDSLIRNGGMQMVGRKLGGAFRMRSAEC